MNLSEEHRSKHVYIVGKSGMGKSNLLEQIAHSDILQKKAIVAIDPHGELAKHILGIIPRSRTHDVCYIDLSDPDFAVGFNPLLGNEQNSPKASADLTAAFKDIFGSSWGPRLEWFLFNGLVVLNERGNTDLTDLAPLYYDRQHRAAFTANIRDGAAREFWLKEYPSYDDRYRSDAAGPILNKVGQVIASPRLRTILTRRHPRFELGRALQSNQIVVVNLAKGVVGREPAMLLGSLIVSRLAALLFSRSDPLPLSIIADEFHNYSSAIWAELFSESRKYGAQLTVAHQFMNQLPLDVRAGVLGNAGTIVSFRVGADDAPFLVNHLGLEDRYGGGATNITPIQQLTTTPPYQAIVKTPDAPSEETLMSPPLIYRDYSNIVDRSRKRFARARA